jgi:hypothetical protein
LDWIGLDKDVENLVTQCPLCIINQPLIHDAPLQTSELPERPWQKISLDIFGPVNDTYLLTIMDYYSSWPEAIIINDTTSETIIEKLSEIFARYGFPETVLTDNGQQFISAKIEKIYSYVG